MSLGIGITYTNAVSPATRELAAGLSPANINPVVGEEVKGVYRDHLFALNESRANALGGKRTNYYTGAARSVSWTVVPDGVLISIQQIGLALHYFGGTVKPVTKKFLTIPARAEAYGKRASEFNDLEILWGKNGPYALARRVSSSITIGRRPKNGQRSVTPGAVQGGEVMFWLKKEVTIEADPSVLPDEQTINRAVNRVVLDVAHRAWARGLDAPKLASGGPN